MEEIKKYKIVTDRTGLITYDKKQVDLAKIKAFLDDGDIQTHITSP